MPDERLRVRREARFQAGDGDRNLARRVTLMMKKSETKEFRNMLVSLRARLRGDVTAMADSALRKTRSEASGDLSSMPIHMADVGSDAFEQEFTLSLMEHDGSALETT